MNSQSQDRLDRVEQLLVGVAEQTTANTHAIAQMREAIRESRAEFAKQVATNAQGLRELQQVVSETRSDLAHFAEWAEEVTQMLVRLTALQERQDLALEEMRRHHAEADQGFYVLLEEVRYLVRRPDQPPGPPPDSA
ncbi:hypothetical protein L1047_16045 [Synechococcus sp. Nb3U1]|uniref:hypothetical protein n=1 Tax=Synechococcus sp. Nb3U1 TaxID=1914529 RepID=UPI001F2FC72B|nr:hypothetical protein [Synechococcus sp. Nb3U1]MCF2972708.1 hypothetical protein [Synechococcus sp. Nb3U1]